MPPPSKAGGSKLLVYAALYLHILQSLGQLHWRQRSTGSGKGSESQPLTTEPEVRAKLCMSFGGESEGEEEGRDCISYPNLDH